MVIPDKTKEKLIEIQKILDDEMEKTANNLLGFDRKQYDGNRARLKELLAPRYGENVDVDEVIRLLALVYENSTRVERALHNLTKEIVVAYDQILKWTPGLCASMAIFEKYSEYSEKKAEISDVVDQCSNVLTLLKDEIKFYPSDQGAGGRIISALQGVGLLLQAWS